MTIIAIMLFLVIFLVTSGESKLTENINKTVDKNKELIDIGSQGQSMSCEDNDGGKNYFVAGSAATNTETLEDSCDSGVITEYWCNGDNIETVSYLCPKGCTDKACIGGPMLLDGCWDDDGGNNYFAAGTVMMSGETYTDQCIILQGINVLVREYLCEKIEDNPVRVVENVYQCPEGCENNACIYGG